MSLSLRSQLSGTHPYLEWAAGYILDWADRNGGRYTVTSVHRSAAQQWDLLNRPNSRAAQVGCSQHQYGAALDVVWEKSNWRDWWLASANNFGLSTVPGDPVHVQLIPGGRFKEWASSLGLCPDPSYPPYANLPREPDLAVSFVNTGFGKFNEITYFPPIDPIVYE